MFLYFKIMFHYSGTILDLHSFQFIHSVMPNSLQPHALQGFPGGTSPKEPACQCRRVRDRGSIPGSEDPLEEKMATHSSILAWRIPWTEEPSRLHGVAESDTTKMTSLSLRSLDILSVLISSFGSSYCGCLRECPCS